jgi:ribosomal protein S18 acetylase RimI-like enzyme
LPRTTTAALEITGFVILLAGTGPRRRRLPRQSFRSSTVAARLKLVAALRRRLYAGGGWRYRALVEMTMELREISDIGELAELEARWSELAAVAGHSSLFSGPDWLLPWWHAYHGVLDAELMALVGEVAGEVVALAPLYTRVARLPAGLKAREIRICGDAGPRPPALDILVAPGHEEAAGTAFAEHLAGRAEDWDVIDLEPLRDPSRARAFLVSRLAALGYSIQSSEAGGARRIALAAEGIDPSQDVAPGSLRLYADDPSSLRKGLSALRRLSRLEWADREETSPLADSEAYQLLEDATMRLGRAGHARLVRLDDGAGEAIAVALVVDDGDVAVVLAMAVDPEHARDEPGPVARLLAGESADAVSRGQLSLDVVTGAGEYELPDLPSSRRRSLRVRAFGDSSAAALARTYGAVRRRVETARYAPGAAAAGARAAWTKIRTAAASVTGYLRLHLYRGELWVRGIAPTEGLTLERFEQAELEALSPDDLVDLVESLDLDQAYCRSKWERGDLVVLARINGRPAGIAWCARRSVELPELDRTLRLGVHEAYIHDVFVAPQARGRSVAPSMLEFLAKELRARDVYRSWALIDPENVASVRAFEKATYTAVADVIYARVANHLRIRPPDPEARKLFGV